MTTAFPLAESLPQILGLAVVSLAAGAGLSRRVTAPGARSLMSWLRLNGLAILATAGLIALARVWSELGAWLAPAATHLEAWFIIWTISTLGALGEAGLRWGSHLRGRPFPVPPLLMVILRWLFLGGVTVWVLHAELGWNITPVLASTAIVTAVVGFALQGVLGNLLAGMSIHLVRSFHEGDWISVGDIDGQVLSTNWRETRLRTTDGMTVILPNSAVAGATVKNFSQPNTKRRHEIFLSIGHGHAPAEVTEALQRAAASVPDVELAPAPTAYIAESNDWGARYRLFFWSLRFQDRRPINGRVFAAAWYELRRRGITPPMPLDADWLRAAGAAFAGRPAPPPDPADLQARMEAIVRSDFGRRVLGAEVVGEGNPPGFESMLRRTRRLRYRSGEALFRQGDPGEACYIVLRGRLRGEVRREGVAEPATFESAAGALVGEMSLVTGLPRTATIVAVDECELLEIDAAAFGALLAVDADLPHRVTQLVTERLAANAEMLDRLAADEAARVREQLKPQSLIARLKAMIAG
ncbi:MAG: mechanosensitive ion channel [Lentisphaerae bacterium]|nr:mechanosensitive ion channel [Lentisphaerota bacterium]